MSSGIDVGSGWAADMEVRGARRHGSVLRDPQTRGGPGTGASSVDPRTSRAHARRRRRALHSNHGPTSSAVGTPESPSAQPLQPPSLPGSIGAPLVSLVSPVGPVGPVGPSVAPVPALASLLLVTSVVS